MQNHLKELQNKNGGNPALKNICDDRKRRSGSWMRYHHYKLLAENSIISKITL